MSDQDEFEAEGQSTGVADRLLNKVKNKAKEAAKELMRRIIKAVVRALVKAIAYIIAEFGVPILFIVACVVLFFGGALLVGKIFAWFSPDDGVDIQKLQARYQAASEKTADDSIYRAPMWLIQALDNIRITKQDVDPEDIDPESIGKNLKADVSYEKFNTTTESWTETDGSSTSPKKTSVSNKMIRQVHTWNRLITYTYIQVQDASQNTEYSSVSGTKEAGGSEYKSHSSNSNRWVIDKVVERTFPGGSIVQYYYKELTDTSFSSVSTPLKGSDSTATTGTQTSYNSSITNYLSSSSSSMTGENTTTTIWHYLTKTVTRPSSSTVSMLSFSNSSSKTSSANEKKTRWVLSEINEQPNYDKFEKAMVDLDFTKSDFDFLLSAFDEDDPSYSSITGYYPYGLQDDIFSSDESGFEGGIIPDSPDIPASSTWAFPTNQDIVISSPFGWRFDETKGKRALHKGIDIARKDKHKDYPIYAVDDGVVLWAGNAGDGYGNKVVISQGEGVETWYAHMQTGSLQVKKGDVIQKGKSLGIMGATGMVTGVHLHFEVRFNHQPVNPYSYLTWP